MSSTYANLWFSLHNHGQYGERLLFTHFLENVVSTLRVSIFHFQLHKYFWFRSSCKILCCYTPRGGWDICAHLTWNGPSVFWNDQLTTNTLTLTNNTANYWRKERINTPSIKAALKIVSYVFIRDSDILTTFLESWEVLQTPIDYEVSALLKTKRNSSPWPTSAIMETKHSGYRIT